MSRAQSSQEAGQGRQATLHSKQYARDCPPLACPEEKGDGRKGKVAADVVSSGCPNKVSLSLHPRVSGKANKNFRTGSLLARPDAKIEKFKNAGSGVPWRKFWIGYHARSTPAILSGLLSFQPGYKSPPARRPQIFYSTDPGDRNHFF